MSKGTGCGFDGFGMDFLAIYRNSEKMCWLCFVLECLYVLKSDLIIL